MRRRSVLSGVSALIFGRGIGRAEDSTYRVAVIGHTGRGNYGHGLDKVWLSLPETRIVAVADADENGRQKAVKKLRIAEGFSDYREMLSTVKPDLVAVCPRHPDQHAEMTLASIEAGGKGDLHRKAFCPDLG